MNARGRLEKYIKEDKIYNDWLDENTSYVSDFDKFCIQHCEDIKDLLKENQELKKQLSGTTFCYDEEEHRKLKEQQKEFINYLEDKMNFYKINTQGYSMSLVEEILEEYKTLVNGTERK